MLLLALGLCAVALACCSCEACMADAACCHGAVMLGDEGYYANSFSRPVLTARGLNFGPGLHRMHPCDHLCDHGMYHAAILVAWQQHSLW